jgi:outer membrane protein OmpA-like peptidoglycan-associated protein
VSQGVARSRIGTGGLGEEEPVASNADAAGRQRNRRVEVAIYASKKLQEEARRKAGT